MKKVERERDEGVIVAERLRVDTLLARWLRDVVEPSQRAESTKADYAYVVEKYIVPHLGARPVARLTPLDVEGLLAALRGRGLGQRTVKYAHSVLRAALEQALRWGYVTRNVASLVTVPRALPDPSKVFAYTITEARALLRALVGDRLHALYVVGALVGLRRGELLGLRWSDIDLERRTLRVEQTVGRVRGRGLVVKPLPKTKSSRRTIGLPDLCVEALRDHRRSQAAERLAAGDLWQDCDLVFPSVLGTPLDPRNLTRHFHAACKRAGIRAGRFHNLRHSAASIALAEGVPLAVVKELLGHSSIQVTADLYTHVVPVLLDQAAARVDAAFRGASAS